MTFQEYLNQKEVTKQADGSVIVTEKDCLLISPIGKNQYYVQIKWKDKIFEYITKENDFILYSQDETGLPKNPSVFRLKTNVIFKDGKKIYTIPISEKQQAEFKIGDQIQNEENEIVDKIICLNRGFAHFYNENDGFVKKYSALSNEETILYLSKEEITVLYNKICK